MVLLVTGCRSGFGLLTAVEAARRGHVVYAGLRDLSTREALEEAAQGLEVIPVQLDVTRADQRDAVVQRVLEEQGRIDGLVNNAGIALGGFLEQVEEDELRRVFEVNVFAPWLLTKAVLPAMREQRGGAVVMVSSSSGRTALPGLGTYAGSKFALEGLSEAWRHELALFGIRLVLVEPGPYRTDIWSRNRTLCREATSPDSPYRPYTERLDAVFERSIEGSMRDPTRVAERIVDLVEQPRPALRHPMGWGWHSTLIKWLPFRVVEWVMQRLLRSRCLTRG